MNRPFRQVDVFSDRLGLGNPVAVVLDADGLGDDEMARFARWTNLSESTFVLAPTDSSADYRVRIFTPGEELPFAGHPTIGTCHAWLEAGGRPKNPNQIVQQCGVGLVTLRGADDRLAFATPPLIRSGKPTPAERLDAARCLGLDPEEIVDCQWIDNGPGWLGVRIDSTTRLAELEPVLGPTDKLGVVALSDVSHEARNVALVVRAFFHAGGTREDPVTGSLNGSVAQWLLGDGTLEAPYVASQGSAMMRDGRVHVHRADGAIWVGGAAVTGVSGVVDL